MPRAHGKDRRSERGVTPAAAEIRRASRAARCSVPQERDARRRYARTPQRYDEVIRAAGARTFVSDAALRAQRCVWRRVRHALCR